MGNWNPEWVQAVVAALALWAAVVAAVLSFHAYKASFRPMIRVVPVFDDVARFSPLLDRVVLKNIGRGPGISIVILERRGSSVDDLLAEVDSLEPLGETYGPNFSESSRVGRVEVRPNRKLIIGGSYRVLYVDIAGRWHETDFEVLDNGFNNRLALTRIDEEIPPWVRERSQIVTKG